MRFLLGTMTLAASIAGCSTNRPGNELPVGFMGPVWSSTISAPDGSTNSAISGFGMMIGNVEHTQTRVQLDLRHARAGSELPWHLHRGSCGNDQGIVGDPAKYAPLTVGADGEASQVAVLDLPLPDSGQYMINVHAGVIDMATVIACGNLTGPTS